MSVQDRIKEQISNDNIVLYMKGTPQFPQCGFSGQSVQILQACGVMAAAPSLARNRPVAPSSLPMTYLSTPKSARVLKILPIGPPFPSFTSTGNLSAAVTS